MGKMKDISIELEEAGLDPFDNSNLQGYVDDTHHFGEDVLKVVDYNTRDINVAAQFIDTGIKSVKFLLRDFTQQIDLGPDPIMALSQQGDPYHFGIDLARGPDLTSLGLATKNADGSLNFDIESGGLFSRHMIVNGRQMGKSFMNQQLGRIYHQLKRYSYSGRLAKGRLHYDVIDRYTREVVNTYRQIKKAKALVKELNRG